MSVCSEFEYENVSRLFNLELASTPLQVITAAVLRFLLLLLICHNVRDWAGINWSENTFTNTTFTYLRSGPMCRDKCRPFCQLSLQCCPFLHPFTPYPLTCTDVHKLEGETSCQYTYISMATEWPALSCIWLADTLVLFRHWWEADLTMMTNVPVSQWKVE